MTAGRPTVILALTPIAEQQVERLLFDTDSPLKLLSSAVEADELQRSVGEEHPQAVLLSPELSGLTPAHCERVRAAGARLIGLALDDRERQALAMLGVDRTIDPSISREELLHAIEGEHAQTPLAVSAPPRPARHGEDGGSIVAVVGSKGAPGASECAASLAALASWRWPTVLVECDALGGGLDVRLGADGRQGSLLGLIRATQTGEGVLGELLERWLTEREGWPAVLLAPPDLDATSELAAPGALAGALHELVALYPLAVCDVGFLLTDGREVPGAARIHREALVSADAVLLVLGARDVQVREGLRQLDLLLDTLGIAPERLRIVANAIGAPGSSSKASITQTLTLRLAEHGVTVDAWLAWDERGLKSIQRRGTPLGTARRRSGYTRALTSLLDELFLPDSTPTPTPKRRKRRLTASGHRHEHQEDEVALPWQS
jgi:hypothetical protein